MKLTLFVTYRASIHVDDRVSAEDVESRANQIFGDYTDGRYQFYPEMAHEGFTRTIESIAGHVTYDLASKILSRYRTPGQLVQRPLHDVAKRLPEAHVDRIVHQPSSITVVRADTPPADALEAVCAHLRERIAELEMKLYDVESDLRRMSSP